MPSPLISVLLPFYNSHQFLEACLHSIKNQSFKQFEVVMVDDGSIDDSPNIAENFTTIDSRFRLIQLKENTGIVSALNEGVKHCKGKYIARMDADDIMLEKRLERQLLFAEENSDVDLFGCQVLLKRTDAPVTSGQERYVHWSNSLISNKAITEEIFAESPIMHPTFFMKREFMIEMKGYEDNPWAEDYDFILRAYIKGKKFKKLPEVLLIKQDHPTRVVRNDMRCKRKAMFEAKVHYFLNSQLFSSKSTLKVIGKKRSGKPVLKAFEKLKVPVGEMIEPSLFNTVKASGGSSNASSDNLLHRVTSQGDDQVFYIIVIDNKEEKTEVLNQLKACQLRLNKDFTVFI